MKEIITIPEGAGAIEILKCSDRVIIEFVPEQTNSSSRKHANEEST